MSSCSETKFPVCFSGAGYTRPPDREARHDVADPGVQLGGAVVPGRRERPDLRRSAPAHRRHAAPAPAQNTNRVRSHCVRPRRHIRLTGPSHCSSSLSIERQSLKCLDVIVRFHIHAGCFGVLQCKLGPPPRCLKSNRKRKN